MTIAHPMQGVPITPMRVDALGRLGAGNDLTGVPPVFVGGALRAGQPQTLNCTGLGKPSAGNRRSQRAWRSSLSAYRPPPMASGGATKVLGDDRATK